MKSSAPHILVLPAPISSNNLFSNVKGRGRVVTKRYAAWKRQAAEMLSIQGPLPAFSCPVKISYLIGEKGVGMMDSGNAEKAYTDALVKAGVITDDSRKWVRRTAPEWVPGMAGCVAVIEPANAGHSAAQIAEMVKPGLRGLLT